MEEKIQKLINRHKSKIGDLKQRLQNVKMPLYKNQLERTLEWHEEELKYITRLFKNNPS